MGNIIGNRSKTYTDVVAFPATRTLGTAATVTGSMLFPYESGASAANVYLSGDTVDGDTLTIKTYVSFTVGDTKASATWFQVDEDKKGHNSTFTAGGGAAYRRFFIPFAPRVRVDAYFDEGVALLAAHNLNVDVEFLELENGVEGTYFGNVVDVGDSLTLEVLATEKNGDTLAINGASKLYIWCSQANTSKLLGDSGIVANIQGSPDAENWFTICTSTALPVQGDSIYASSYQIIERPDFPTYARIQITGDSHSSWITGHGIKYHVMSVK